MAKGHNPIFAGMSGTFGPLVIYQSGGQTILRERVCKQRGGPTTARANQQAAFSGLVWAWKGLDAARQFAWTRLGARMPDWDDTRAPKPLSGYQCFLGVNTGRLALALPPLLDAPDAPDLPPFLPVLALTADLSAPALSLTLTCGGQPFAAPVQVFAARPASPNAAPPRVKDMARLTTLDGLPADGVDIGALYLSKFRAVAPGMSVTIRAVPLSPTGFRGQALSVSGIVEP